MSKFNDVLNITIIIMMIGFSFYGIYQFWCNLIQKVRETILERKRRAVDKVYDDYLENNRKK